MKWKYKRAHIASALCCEYNFSIFIQKSNHFISFCQRRLIEFGFFLGNNESSTRAANDTNARSLTYPFYLFSFRFFFLFPFRISFLHFDDHTKVDLFFL